MQSIDFRKGIDGIAAVCRNQLQEDPHTGTLFLFRNRSKCSIRILVYDGQGFWLCTKRLSHGKFKWWPQSPSESISIQSWDLQTLLGNVMKWKQTLPAMHRMEQTPLCSPRQKKRKAMGDAP
jgi:transposase